MRKFVRGTLQLEEYVEDTDAYTEKHRKFLESMVAWADRMDVQITFGASNDNAYLCEYVIIGNTKQYCNGLFSELKEMLKPVFPKVKTLFQGSGDKL